jgi:hypothetical protein
VRLKLCRSSSYALTATAAPQIRSLNFAGAQSGTILEVQNSETRTKTMPVKGRNRLVASKTSGTKLFVDDLREVSKLTQTEHKTASDLIRELVHEALVTRRQRAIGRDEEENHLRQLHQQAITAGVSSLEKEIKRIGEIVGKFASNGHQQLSATVTNKQSSSAMVQSLLTEVLGFTMATEIKTHLLLQNFLLSRGLSEESVQALIAEHEAKSRQQTEQIITGLLPA